MSVQLTVTIDPTSKTAPGILRGLADSMAATFEGAHAQVNDVVRAPAKAAKATKAAVEVADDEDDEENFELATDDGGEAADVVDAEETEEADDAPTLDDVTKAFQTYAKKHSREKAAAILKKLGAKSVRDIKPGQYEKVLKTLGA